MPLFQFTEKSGPHGVGLQVVEQYDFSRTYQQLTDELGKDYQGERARPLQTLVWYPAERTNSQPLRVSDYLALWATETNFRKPRVPIRAQEWRSSMEPTLGMSLWAVRDAPPLCAHFPVIIYAPSFSSVSWENADLCEYLASHGYVVIASPSMGVSTRMMTLDLAGINAQARDISFLISYAHSRSNSNMSEIAVAGFSWGGISNLFTAARDNRVNALIALDGNLRFSPGLVKLAGDVHPEEMTIPLLSFGQREFSFEDQDRCLTAVERDGPSVLNAWTHGDLIDVRMLGLTHVELSSMFQRREDLWREIFNYWQMNKADYDREDGIEGYAWLARYVLAFVDGYLKHDEASISYLKNTPAANGVPRHTMSVTYRAASGPPASLAGFRKEVGRQGFERVADIYEGFRKRRPAFALEEHGIRSWAEELVDSNHVHEAIHLLNLLAQIYPSSSTVFECLGDIYLRCGQQEKAIDNYRTALDKNPMNAGARRRIRQLDVVDHDAPSSVT